MRCKQAGIEVIPVLLANSDALSRHIRRHPECVKLISELSLEKTENAVKKLVAGVEKAMDETIKRRDMKKVLMLLRVFRYNAFSILSFNYLTGRIGTEEFSSAWSTTAEKCVDLACRAAMPVVEAEYGLPVTDNDGGFKYAVIALGKLGAGELNVSSDIDLLFIYNTDDGRISNSPEKSLNEFASRLSQRIMLLLSSVTVDGFCYRVDTDLRPEGRKGPLANSIDAAINFFNNFGGEFERMMLIRANPVGGDAGLGNEFTTRIKPFIYRRSLDSESLIRIKEIKEKIANEAVKSAKKGLNIKLGTGGIREAEFIVHALQLIHGGHDEKMTARNTFEALRAIKKGGYLPSRQAEELAKAYEFLRHMENMLQLPSDEQTHLLPSNRASKEALAIRMGYSDIEMSTPADRLIADFDAATDTIKHHFTHLFEENPERYQMVDAILTNISSCSGEEEDIDSLTWFKKEETKKIQFLDLEKGLPPDKVSEKLSLVAEVVISEAYKMALGGMRSQFGPPISRMDGGEAAELAVVGMGKLGGREIDYASDIDLMFIYSGDGETAGPKKISNQEFFTKLSQRIISIITLPTRYGKAYQIDADLRPSGRAGILVSSIESFRSYHFVEGMTWERQALLKARPIAGDPKFCDTVKKLLDDIRYASPPPEGLKTMIAGLRKRMEKEKAIETARRFNIKLGKGGLMDVETIAQYMQIRYGWAKESIRTTETLKCIERLAAEGLLEPGDAEKLLASYTFLKKLLSRVRLFSDHATDYLDAENELIPQIANGMGLCNEKELMDRLNSTRTEVRRIYLKYMT